MDKQSLILKLHKDGKVTDDEAKLLLQENERIVYVDRYVQPYIPFPQLPLNPYPSYPYISPQYPITTCEANAGNTNSYAIN